MTFKRCGSCCSCLCTFIQVLVFLAVCVVVKFFDVWDGLLEFPVSCSHPELPENRSGVSVLVAGFAKSGTRTISHALNGIGIRTYHSEDFYFWSYREYISQMRKFNESYKATIPAYMHFLLTKEYLDPRASGTLASSISRCRMDSVALDGIEQLFWPIYEVSPGAKVILVDWRSYKSWTGSNRVFLPKLMIMCLFNIVTGSSFQILPWGAILRLLDPLVGRPIQNALSDGGPPLTEVSGPMMFFYHQMLNHRNQYKTWFPLPGTGVFPQTEEEYNSWFEAVRQGVPKEHLWSWDPRKHRFEDLCQFLGISPCPQSGPMPRAVNTWIFERDFPVAGNLVLAMRLFMHWVNWRLLKGLVSFLLRPCRRKEEKSD